MSNKHGLPGTIWLNHGRWYWKVKLPGDIRRKDIPLIPSEAKYATNDYGVAVEIAREIYRRHTTTPRPGEGESIADLVGAYLAYAQQYYRQGRELVNIQAALTHLTERYGRIPAEDFGPKDLRYLQEQMIELTYRNSPRRRFARSTINKYIGIYKRVFNWAVAEGRLPPSVGYGLNCVANLKKNRSDAREGEVIQPVTKEQVWAVLPYCSSVVAAMVQVHYYTGMRPTELCNMRWEDIDRTDKVWVYRPAELEGRQAHKTAHLGHERAIAIGPRAQAVINSLIKREEKSGFVFSPQVAVREMRQRRRKQRKTPEQYGNRPGTNRKAKPQSQPGDHYNRYTYAKAIRRACIEAKINPWAPNQLRHTAATRIRREMGLDAAGATLGHSTVSTTQICAGICRDKAIAVAEKMG